jgi:hypothetical protein
MRRTTLLVSVVLALGLSACGSQSADSDSAATTAAVGTAVAAPTTVAESSDTTMAVSTGTKAKTVADAKAQMQADSGLSTAQAGCIVDKLVAAVGETKALELVNVEDDLTEMSPADQKTAGDALLTCVSKDDFATLIADGLYDEMGSLGVTKAQATCVGSKMIELVTPEGLIGLGNGAFDFENMDPADQGKLFQIFVDCLPPDVIGKMAGAIDGAGSTTAAASTSTTKG